MINLEKTELVLFDFDDTLCIHEAHGCDEIQEFTYDVNVLKNGADAWTGKPSAHMRDFIEECKKRKIRMGLISATVSVKHAEGKLQWVSKQYGVELENYCVGTFENKLRIMKAISGAYNIPNQNILLVDDYWENLERAANAGFSACTPMEVVGFIERL